MKMPVAIHDASSTTSLRAVIGAVTTTVACVMPVFLVGGLAVQIRDELRFDPAGLGLVVSIYFAVGALASVPSGALVERFGPTATARAGIVAAALGMGGISLAGSYPVLLVVLALSGVGNALGQLASNATLAGHVPPHRQGISFGVKQAAIPSSTLLAGLAVPAVALTAGWRWAFAAAAVLAATALLLVPRDGRLRRNRARGGRATGALMVIGLSTTLASGGAGALGTFLVDSSVAGGLGPAAAGLALTGGSLACVIARVLGGWFADRRTGGHVTVVAALLAVGAVGLALLATPSRAALVVGVLLGFGLGWSWPGLLNFAVVQLHPQAPAAATSITQTGVYAGGSLGPLAFGTAAATAGYPAAWLGASGALLAAALLMLGGGWLLHRHTPPAPADAAEPIVDAP